MLVLEECVTLVLLDMMMYRVSMLVYELIDDKRVLTVPQPYTWCILALVVSHFNRYPDFTLSHVTKPGAVKFSGIFSNRYNCTLLVQNYSYICICNFYTCNRFVTVCKKRLSCEC